MDSHSAERSLVGEHDAPLSVLAVAFLGGPLSYVAHLGLSYFLVALGCTTGWAGTDTALALATLLLASSAGAAGWVAHRLWRRSTDGRGWLTAVGESGGRSALVAMLGMLGAGLFLFLILLAGLPPLFVPTCT